MIVARRADVDAYYSQRVTGADGRVTPVVPTGGDTVRSGPLSLVFLSPGGFPVSRRFSCPSGVFLSPGTVTAEESEP